MISIYVNNYLVSSFMNFQMADKVKLLKYISDVVAVETEI